MRTPRIPALALTATLVLASPPPLEGQAAPPGFRAEIGGQFQASARKLVALAEAMPESSMTWRPMEGVASVADAYMHIARYNYYYPDVALGVAPGADYEAWQGHVTDKAEVVRILRTSMDHVRAVMDGLTDEDLNRPTRLYGREVGQWAVLLQLVTHMNEHLGQEIAYARMNGVAPPWSR
jgi:uncharacterized damage-inducible protein DinB